MIQIEVTDIPLHLTYTVDLRKDAQWTITAYPFQINTNRVNFTYNHLDATLQLQTKIDDANVQVSFKHSDSNKT